MSEKAKAKQIQVEVSGASSAGTLQELIEDRKIYRPANIGVTPGEYDIEISSSTGTPGTIPSATITTAGAMSKDDKVKVNDLPDAAGLADSLSKKVDKVPGEKLITDDQATKLDELPDSATLSVTLGNKVDKVSGSKLITNGQAAKLDGLPDSEALGVSLSNKVDKAPGYTLVAEAEAVKLSGLPDVDTLSTALSGKVSGEEGSGLMTDDQSTKLDELPDNAALGAALDNKVDKEQGRSLIDDGEALKLAALPTADALSDALDSKVDAETGKGLIYPAPLTGALYGQKNGVWTEVPSGGGGGASALGDLSDVSLGTLADDEVLAWDGAAGKWVNKVSQGGAAALAELTDVDFGTPTDGQVLTWDDATQKSKFTDQAGGGGGDVEEAPVDGEMYLRGNGTWNKYAGEKIIYVDFPLENGVQHKFTEADFTDTSAVYRGVAEVNEYYAAEYEAFYLQLIEGWVMHFSIQGYDYKVALTQGEVLLLSAIIRHSVPTALLPSGLSRVEYRGRFDVLEGLEGGSAGEVDITVDSNSSYVADTLIESQNIPKTPLDFSLGDVEGFFTNPISLDSAPNSSSLTGGAFANGFGRGKVYWEVNFVYQDQDGDNMKVKYQSEAGGSSTTKFTLPIAN